MANRPGFVMQPSDSTVGTIVEPALSRATRAVPSRIVPPLDAAGRLRFRATPSHMRPDRVNLGIAAPSAEIVHVVAAESMAPDGVAL